MQRFWDTFVRRVLEVLGPPVVVEIGAETGANTRNILAYCASAGARCHVIDPDPITNLAEIGPLLERFGTHHRDLSLNVLSTIPGALYLIDGDHNWYTVYHELKAIVGRAERDGAPLPVMLLHDVGWPYGRRDMYYDPERIPAEFRRPYVRRGMFEGRSALAERGGLNPTVAHALTEGGPRNGVLAAIEEFLTERAGLYRFRSMPGLHGIGLLFPADLVPAARADLEAIFQAPDHVVAHLASVERDRNGEWERRDQDLSDRTSALEAERDALRSTVDATRAERDALRREAESARAERDAIRSEFEALRTGFSAFQSSKTYRLVVGLRDATAWLRRSPLSRSSRT